MTKPGGINLASICIIGILMFSQHLGITELIGGAINVFAKTAPGIEPPPNYEQTLIEVGIIVVVTILCFIGLGIETRHRRAHELKVLRITSKRPAPPPKPRPQNVPYRGGRKPSKKRRGKP